jgi:alpha-tubulin suppressor-like RCC1 family protein
MDGYVGLSCGGEHTLFVDRRGGLASAGACGLGWSGSHPDAQAQATLDRRAHPCAVSTFLTAVARQTLPPMRKAVGGYYHSMAISTAGKLYSWGCGNFGAENDGQLGLGADKQESLSPREVELPLESGEQVVDAATGCYHSAVLTSQRRVFTFGLNNYGQLGRGGIPAGAAVPRSPSGISAEADTASSYSDGVPRLVENGSTTSGSGSAASEVEAIGAGFYNVYQLTRGGGMRCAGSNAARQCGSAAATHSAPTEVPELRGVALRQATGGYCHTIALSQEGMVFTLGCGEDGQRGDARPLESDQVPEEMQERHDELVEVRETPFVPSLSWQIVGCHNIYRRNARSLFAGVRAMRADDGACLHYPYCAA